MKQLIKYELYKLWTRKIILFTFFMLIIFLVLRFQYTHNDFINIDTKQQQALLSTLNGPIDETFENKIQILQKKYEIQNPPKTENDRFNINRLFSEPKDVFLNYQYNVKIHNDILKMHNSPLKNRYVQTSTETYHYDSNGINWANTIRMIDEASYACIFIFLIICISTIFSQERDYHMEKQLLTTKEGRSHCLKAKIIAAYVLTSFILLVFICVVMMLLYINYGYDGYQGNLSLYAPFTNGYRYDALTMFFWQCLLLLSSSLLFTSVTLWISKMAKSMITAVISAIAFFVLPILLINISFLRPILYAMPSYTAHLTFVFKHIEGFQFYDFVMLRPEYTILLNLLSAILLTYLLYHSFHHVSYKQGDIAC